MSDIEYHLLRVTVLINKVNLTVRFPCSLLFQLKACKSSKTQKARSPRENRPTNSRVASASPTRNSPLTSKCSITTASTRTRK